MNLMTFHSVGNFIIPTDFHSIIFQRGRAQPPTSYSSKYLLSFFCVSCRFRFDDPGVWFSGWMSKTVRSDWFTDSEWSKICGGSQRFAFPFWTWSLGQTSATKNHFKAGKHLVLLVGPGSDFNASWIFYGLNQGWIPMDIELRWIKRVETCSSSKNWHLPRLMKWAVELLSSPSGP